MSPAQYGFEFRKAQITLNSFYQLPLHLCLSHPLRFRCKVTFCSLGTVWEPAGVSHKSYSRTATTARIRVLITFTRVKYTVLIGEPCRTSCMRRLHPHDAKLPATPHGGPYLETHQNKDYVSSATANPARTTGEIVFSTYPTAAMCAAVVPALPPAQNNFL